MSSWTGCTSTSDANAWNRCTNMSFETALVTFRRAWPGIRLDHPGGKLGLACAARQRELRLCEPNRPAQIRAFHLRQKQIGSCEIHPGQIQSFEVGSRQIGVAEAYPSERFAFVKTARA